MARMTLKAVHTDGEPRRWTLSERIVDENLGSYKYVARPRERLRLATTGTAVLESQSADLAEDHHDDETEHAQPDDQVTRRHVPAYSDEELADAAWLYAWSHAALRPVGESIPA